MAAPLKCGRKHRWYWIIRGAGIFLRRCRKCRVVDGWHWEGTDAA